MSESNFTRTRKQTFSCTLLFVMNFLKKSLAIEIENFLSYVKSGLGSAHQKSFTKSAFTQCRNKISPLVFKYLSSKLIHEFYTDNELSVKLWNGFRLLSVDGSRVTLPNTIELRNIYGEAKNHTNTTTTQGRLSVLYDVLNNYAIDGLLEPLSVGEKALAIKHLEYTKERDLIIYDRGYPSFDLIYEHTKRNIDFLIRVKINFSNQINSFYKSRKKSATIKLRPGNKRLSDKEFNKDSTIEVRLIRIELSDGEVEILITSLLDSKKYKHSIFKSLYYKRWGIETYYDEFKNKLKLEYFSGYSSQSIQQDFYAALFVSNIQTLIVSDINEELDSKERTTKYQYKVNTNLSYGFLKDRVISLLFSEATMQEVMPELRGLFKKYLIPIRPNRCYPRETRKYDKRKRPKVLKNQRDAF